MFGRVCAISQGPVRTAECGATGAVGRRTGGHGRVAGTADGVGQTGAGEGGLGQSDPRGAELVFGEQPADRSTGGSAAIPGPCGGLVWAEEGGRSAAVARTEQASGGLPAHPGMVGTEAG